MPKRYWLVKSEPDCFSIQDLAAAPRQTTCWSGVRNFQARNFMRDQMQLGDRVLYYHSSAEPPAVAGIAEVVREAYPDHTAWDEHDDHYDPKASPDNPIWQMVDIRLDSIFAEPLALAELREIPELKQMELLRRGSRLSVQPVAKSEFEAILKLAKSRAAGRKRAGHLSQPCRTILFLDCRRTGDARAPGVAATARRAPRPAGSDDPARPALAGQLRLERLSGSGRRSAADRRRGRGLPGRRLGAAQVRWSAVTRRRRPQLEARLADLQAVEAALVFSAGFAANVGAIAALSDPATRCWVTPRIMPA